jgi:PAS domain S-box-containing protein
VRDGGAPLTQTSRVARILVALPSLREAGNDLLGIVPALRRLGPELQLEVVASAASCVARVARGDVDLVVADARLEAEATELLAALRDGDTPVVVVLPRPTDAAVVEARRFGAAACLGAGDSLAEALPRVVLDEIQRVEEARARGTARRLEQLERLNDAVVKAIPAALAVLDADERVLTVNPGFVRSFGGAAAGMPLGAVLPRELLESGGVRELLARARSGQECASRVGRMRSDDGALRAFDLRATRLDDEGRLLLVLSDVSERELLARRIAELQLYNENIIQNINSALLVVNADGAITFANPTAERILGAEALPGRRIWDWFPTTPREQVLIARTLGQGARFRGAETIITLADGRLVPIGISCAPLASADVGRLGAVAIFQDLSEIKGLQRQALQNEKLASIGQLAAGVAHEINNPTGFIHSNLLQMAEYLTDLRKLWDRMQTLQEAVRSGDLVAIRAGSQALDRVAEEIDADFIASDFAKAVRESQEGSERIRHIVQDLRDFSRQDTGEQAQADLNDCLDSTANIVWTMMKHSVVLKRDYGELPRLGCHPMQLKQVFMNLLMNAYQAIAERVGQSGETGEIRLSTRRRGQGILISVSDTGVGIPPENLGRIFDPFFTTKEVGVGTGLGLSTSFGIVQRHGGTIRVRSELGEGSTFEVFLPLEPGDGLASAGAA